MRHAEDPKTQREQETISFPQNQNPKLRWERSKRLEVPFSRNLRFSHTMATDSSDQLNFNPTTTTTEKNPKQTLDDDTTTTAVTPTKSSQRRTRGHYNKSGLWWWNLSSQYVLISSPNTYGDEMMTKQHSSPKLHHRMYCFVANKKW